MADRNKMKELRIKKLQEEQSKMLETPIESTLDLDTPLSTLVNSLTSDESSKQIFYAEPDTFVSYPDAKIRLKLHDGDKKESLKESIQQDGILEPVLVWMDGGNKIVLAGHNRINVAKELGLKVPYIIMDDVDKKRADRIVVITNLQNRQYSEMLPSELSNMLSRLVISYDDSVYKENVYQDINQEFSLSKRKIIQYLRLQKLSPDLMQMLDEQKIPLYVAYQLSGVSMEKQVVLYDFIQEHQIASISMKQVDRLLEREKTAWDTAFLMNVFGLSVTLKKKAAKKTISIDQAKLLPYLLEDEQHNVNKAIIKVLSQRQKMIEKLQAYSKEYSDDLLLEIVDDYFSNK